ncbi:MAG: PPOX class F420-dependent oxidoreductase [Acidimicrobiia bacterium]|nr:PPOX class F420-dependent oxidoreductase [Acidimicrobiia bacterium]MDH4306920.1 PPOX class F420-dependent oxidoreductase [Acidimicrobiia bacterium]MDH5293973.1 PPOX class F420-dependent oxidoreductase [Acidimicrobiia bacterium]
MARSIATETAVGRTELLDFIRPRNHWVLGTTRRDGRVQLSPVTGGVAPGGSLVVATYPERDKTHNARRNPDVTVCVLSDDFGGPWVQVDGSALVSDMPEAEDGLVEYFRCIAGEHPDWVEYREAMRTQDKSLITITIDRWGPIATGGFPPRLAD